MRASILLLALAACTPEIAPGTYLCGPEETCPDEQACDGPTNTCVLASAAKPFACGDTSEVEPNDAFQSAQLVTGLQCVSAIAELLGCAGADGNAEDWFQFSVPASCTAVNATARLVFPLAFEPLSLELRDGGGTTRATGDACPQDDPSDGDDQLCIDAPVTPGAAFAFRVAGSGTANCDGDCAHNRYILTMQLARP